MNPSLPSRISASSWNRKAEKSNGGMLNAHRIGLRQGGAALLLMLVLLVIGAGSFFIDSVVDTRFERQKQLRTQNALDTAKKALIAYAVSAENRPGELPCTDVDNDGKIDGAGGNCSSLRGWLPWFRLGLGDIRDGDGERLWYAISDSFRPYGEVPPGVPLNPDTQTDILINGIDPTEPYVAAVIISPGAPVPGNAGNRTEQTLSGSTADDLVASYLEGSNSGLDKAVYSRQPATDGFNDAVMVITVAEIMQHVQSRVKQTVIGEIERYRTLNGFYPYAESVPGGVCDGTSTQTEGYLQYKTAAPCVYTDAFMMADWFEENNWHRMFWFAFDASCGYPGGMCIGNMTVDTVTNVEALALYSSAALDAVSNSCGATYSQSLNRPSSQPCDYFDNTENYDADGVFETPVDSATSNDELTIVN
jgi:hypothetical protein